MKKLTKEELNLALEAILFASCVDMCSEINEKDANKLIDIAIKLKGTNDVNLNKIYLYGSPKLYEDKVLAKKIKKNFKVKTKKF